MIQSCHDWDSSDLSWLWWFSSVMIVMVQLWNYCDDLVLSWLQGWEFALSLFTLLLKITNFKKQATVSDLRSPLLKKERPWANHYRRSLKKSDHVQIALVALYKRATMSESLSSLFKKERPWANHSCCSLQKSNVSKSLSLLFNKEQHEWLARDSSKLLTKNEQFMIVMVQNFHDRYDSVLSSLC